SSSFRVRASGSAFDWPHATVSPGRMTDAKSMVSASSIKGMMWAVSSCGLHRGFRFVEALMDDARCQQLRNAFFAVSDAAQHELCVLAESRNAQWRRCRLHAKVNRAREVDVSGRIGLDHPAFVGVGMVERFGGREHLRHADLAAIEPGEPFIERACQKGLREKRSHAQLSFAV